MIGILTALLSGALMSVQGVFNTQVTKATSLWVSTSFVQFTAFLVCLVIWYFSDGKSFMTLTQVPDKWTPVSYTHLDVYKRQGLAESKVS